MANPINIGGLTLTPIFCNKINPYTSPIASSLATFEPIVNMYKDETSENEAYIVNIISFVPTDIQDIEDKNLTSGYFLNDEQSLFLSYNGVNKELTSIQTGTTDGAITCREFTIDYSHEGTETDYDLYHIQFSYQFVKPTNFQSVDAIVVRDVNLDPRGSRGTVTTVSQQD